VGERIHTVLFGVADGRWPAAQLPAQRPVRGSVATAPIFQRGRIAGPVGNGGMEECACSRSRRRAISFQARSQRSLRPGFRLSQSTRLGDTRAEFNHDGKMDIRGDSEHRYSAFV